MSLNKHAIPLAGVSLDCNNTNKSISFAFWLFVRETVCMSASWARGHIFGQLWNRFGMGIQAQFWLYLSLSRSLSRCVSGVHFRNSYKLINSLVAMRSRSHLRAHFKLSTASKMANNNKLKPAPFVNGANFEKNTYNEIETSFCFSLSFLPHLIGAQHRCNFMA